MARLSFWHITLKDIIIIICSAAIPVALAIYSSIMHKQEQQVEENTRQADLNRTLSLRQQQLYDQFIDNIYKLHKNGYLAENQTPWAFANAFYRSAHRKWDPVRKADVLLFLKEQNLIARSICSANCERQDKPDIIRLEKLSFEHVRLLSQTGNLAAIDLQCITFENVIFNSAVFSSVNLNGVSFIGGQSKYVKFEGSSLRCAKFEGVDLQGIDFGDADLTDTVFSNVDLSTVNLTKEQLQQAIFDSSCKLPIGMSNDTRSRLRTPAPLSTTTRTTTIIPKTSTTTTTTTTTEATSTARATTTTTDTTTTTTTNRTTTATEEDTTTEKTAVTTEDPTAASESTARVNYSSTVDSATRCDPNDTLINFDDLSTGGTVPNGYKNFNWYNALYQVKTVYENNSGYFTATTSGNYSGYNVDGEPMMMTTNSSLLFTMKSASVAAAWKDNLQLEIVGYRSNNVIMNRTFTLQIFEVTYVDLTGYWRLDQLSFNSFGGKRNAAVPGNGLFFAIDDLCLTFE